MRIALAIAAVTTIAFSVPAAAVSLVDGTPVEAFAGIGPVESLSQRALPRPEVSNLPARESGLPSGSDSVPAVPEPATWAMLIAGFAVVGAAARRRRFARA